MKILVTGAEGFIGSHLTESLLKKGYDVRATYLYNSFNNWGWLEHISENLKNKLDVQPLDVRDSHNVLRVVEGCDVIFHLAALIAIPYSYEAPGSYIETNIRGTLNLLEAAKKYNIKQFIHTSTSEVYGTAQFIPITELHPLYGQSPYSASKIAADHLALSFFSSYESPIIILRPFNTYGPRQSARAVIPTIITQILSGNLKLKLGNLDTTRDFTYVEDTVDAFIKVLNVNDCFGQVINIGSSFEISIRDLAFKISKLMNVKIDFEVDKKRMRPKNSEVERLYASSEKAKKLINWSIERTAENNLNEGLIKTIKWLTNPKILSTYKTEIYNI